MKSIMIRVGYWISEKKSKKLFDGFDEHCRKEGIEAVRLNLELPLESQGPFDLLLHKLNDELAKAEQGDEFSMNRINIFQRYCSANPHIPVLDSFTSIRTLLDRHQQYQFVKECYQLHSGHSSWFIPNFVELSQLDIDQNHHLLTSNNVTYPFVVKPIVAQGVSNCHQMSLIFNDAGLKDIQVPCVAQSFVNHNAVMYKIFVVGSRHYIVERPSIKNLYPSDEKSTIFFDSHDVSKPHSASFLNQCDPADLELPLLEPNEEQIEGLAVYIQQRLGLTLFGIDVIIENKTGRYAIIDINAFPGYDGVPDFIQSLLVLVKEEVQASEERKMKISSAILNGVHSDTCFTGGNDFNLQYSSDESSFLNGHLSSGDEILDDLALHQKRKKKIHMQHITFCGSNGFNGDGVTKSVAEFAVDGDKMILTCHRKGHDYVNNVLGKGNDFSRGLDDLSLNNSRLDNSRLDNIKDTNELHTAGC